jgi:MHS family proline/betaine transporter-like MFS transporter
LSTHRLMPKQIWAGAIGNTLEWYDFAVYGFLAPLIGKAFFPSDDPVASLLAAYGALAVGYVSRPLGSFVFGHFGDRIGRKPSLMLSVAVMGCATLAIAVLPSHAQIGITAAVILVLLRCLQGISVAGEYSSSAVLLVEQAPPARRGLVGSWVVMGCNVGFLLGSAVGALVSNLLGDAQMAAWGWRIPFLLGAAIALYAFLLRRGLDESPVMESKETVPTLPALEALRYHWREIGQIVCLVLPTAVTYFLAFVYAISYLTQQMHFSTAKSLDISTLALVLLVLVSPAAGLVADRQGRRAVMFFVTTASLLFTWPLWSALHQDSLAWILFAQLSFAFINGVGWAMTVPVMVELAPARTRCTVAGIGYNLCLAVFGGTTPWVATYLVARTADDFAPAYYIMAAAAVAFVATLRMPEMAGRALRT